MKHMLIVDDELGSRQSLHAIFSRDYKVILADNAKTALSKLNEHRVDIVLLDYMMPDMDGVALSKEIQARYPDVPFVMVSASSTVRPVVDAMRAGAFDFVAKPFDIEEIQAVVRRALEHSGLKRKVEVMETELAEHYPKNAIIGQSPEMKELMSVVQRAAETDATVLIHGESGTGKELIARELHARSPRRDEPFIPVHCGALPDSLMESELFGHEKGAFTGAERRKPGRFDMAGSGTIFFDEISETSLNTQVKLLRVIQEREYMRVGGTQVLHTDARIISACNKDLEKEVEEERFREDLYYRLNVIPIRMPPVRDRGDDVPLLINYFLQSFCKSMNAEMKGVSDEAMALLARYRWPGNVREMRNVIERVVVLHRHEDTLTAECLPAEFRKEPAAPSVETPAPAAPRAAGPVIEPPPLVTSLEDAVNEYERKLVRWALREAGGVQTRAAEILGTTRRILKYRMDKLNITEPGGNGNGHKPAEEKRPEEQRSSSL